MMKNCTLAETLGTLCVKYKDSGANVLPRALSNPGGHLPTPLRVTKEEDQDHDHSMRSYYEYCGASAIFYSPLLTPKIWRR